MMATERQRQFGYARRVVHERGTAMLQQHGMVAVGVGLKKTDGVTTDEVAVKAFVPRKLPPEAIPAGRMVPKTVDVPGARVVTDVEEMAPPTAPAIVADDLALAAFRNGNRARWRPLAGGDSLSRFPGTLGTLGAVVRDRTDPSTLLLLSCNHVLAALNLAHAGDAVVQPAAGDGGTIAWDRCGALLRWVPLWFNGSGINRVAAAVATAVMPALPLIHFVGLPAGVISGNTVAPGTPVFKVGRTTPLTTATVAAVHVSGWLTYSLQPLASAFFTDQIVTAGAVGFGDSGSLLFDNDRNAVGLLFGGSATHTFFNDIVSVQDELGIAVVTSGNGAAS